MNFPILITTFMTLFHFITDSNFKTENYSVLYTYEDFEIRKYNTMLLAKYDDANNQEFSVLANTENS